MRLRQASKLAAAAVAAVALAVMAAPSASAHAPSVSLRVYDTYGLCTIGTATFQHVHGNGPNTAKAITTARVAGCTTIDMFAPGWLAVRYDVQKWKGSATGWVTCQTSNWVFNTTWADKVEVPSSQPNIPSDSSGIPDCDGTANDGPGYFRTLGVHYVWDGSAWRGGAVASPHHQLPA